MPVRCLTEHGGRCPSLTLLSAIDMLARFFVEEVKLWCGRIFDQSRTPQVRGSDDQAVKQPLSGYDSVG